jgi:hypothetical protein
MTDPNYTPFENLILAKVETLDKRVEGIDEKLTLVRIDVAQLKIKAGIWGAAAGMIPALMTGLAVFLGGSGSG